MLNVGRSVQTVSKIWFQRMLKQMSKMFKGASAIFCSSKNKIWLKFETFSDSDWRPWLGPIALSRWVRVSPSCYNKQRIKWSKQTNKQKKNKHTNKINDTGTIHNPKSKPWSSIIKSYTYMRVYCIVQRYSLLTGWKYSIIRI